MLSEQHLLGFEFWAARDECARFACLKIKGREVAVHHDRLFEEKEFGEWTTAAASQGFFTQRIGARSHTAQPWLPGDSLKRSSRAFWRLRLA